MVASKGPDSTKMGPIFLHTHTCVFKYTFITFFYYILCTVGLPLDCCLTAVGLPLMGSHRQEDQKCTLEVAKIIREDFLQQNGFSEYDFM